MNTRDTLQSPAYTSRAASSTSLVTPSLSVLADPPVRLVDAATYDYLVIEMVHALRSSAEVSAARIRAVEDEMRTAGLLPAPPPPEKEKVVEDRERMSTATKRETRSSLGSAGFGMRVGSTADLNAGLSASEPLEEDLRVRLETIGVQVGGNIAER